MVQIIRNRAPFCTMASARGRAAGRERIFGFQRGVWDGDIIPNIRRPGKQKQKGSENRRGSGLLMPIRRPRHALPYLLNRQGAKELQGRAFFLSLLKAVG